MTLTLSQALASVSRSRAWSVPNPLILQIQCGYAPYELDYQEWPSGSQLWCDLSNRVVIISQPMNALIRSWFVCRMRICLSN